jgi:hypothetical protein
MDVKERATASELVTAFDLEKLPKQPVRVDDALVRGLVRSSR